MKDNKESTENKILPILLSFMPAYRLHGETKLQSVSHKWRYYLSDAKLRNKKTAFEFAKSIEACCTPEEALFILSDQNLFLHCRVWQLFHLASMHPRIAKETIDSSLIQTHYSFFLADLASRHIELAHYVLDIAEKAHNISLFSLVRLGKCHLEISWRLLTLPWREKLTGLELSEIGEAHFPIAKHILETPELIDKLQGGQFAKLIGCHTSLMFPLLANPKFKSYLLSTGIYNFDKIDVLFAHEILNIPDLVDKLNCFHLVSLAKAHQSVATRIFKKPKLLQELQKSSIEFAKFGALYEELAFDILKTPALCEGIADWDLGMLAKRHFSVAQYIFKTQSLRNRLLTSNPFFGIEFISLNGSPSSKKPLLDKGHSLMVMGEHNPQTARTILTTPALCEEGELTGTHLAKLGTSAVSNGCLVLNNPVFSAKLSGNDLVTLGVSHPHLAQIILKDALSLLKLDGNDLATLGESDADVALQILQSKTMVQKLSGENLVKITGYFKSRTKFYESIHLGIVEVILSQDELVNKLMIPGTGCSMQPILQEEVVEALQDFLNIGEMLHEIAQEVKREQTPVKLPVRP